MAGQLGTMTRTTQSLEIVRIDAERQLLLIKGSGPRSKGGDLPAYSRHQGTREEGRCCRPAAKGGKK